MTDSPVSLIGDCANFQATMFLRHFMASGKVGEIMCSQVNDMGDRIFFERYCVMDTQFIAVYRVLMEDSMIVENVQFAYKKIEEFVSLRETENLRRFHEKKGEDSKLPYEEFTRQMVEDRLSPGKMTINGDRNTVIRILYRQTEVPNDAQQPRLNEYVLLKPLEVIELEQLGDRFHDLSMSSEQYLTQLAEWKQLYLTSNMQTTYPDLSTTLPFLKAVTRVTPRIYEWPRELDVEREAGMK
jgi:hypothetical protein